MNEQNEEAVAETNQPKAKPHRKKSGRPRGSPNKKKHIEALEKQIERLRGQLAAVSGVPEPEPEQRTDKTAKDKPNPGAPPMPKMDKLAGDKTPEIVEWYRDYWPEEFKRRYKSRSRKTHLRRSFQQRQILFEDEEDKPGKEMQMTHERGLDTEPRSYSNE